MGIGRRETLSIALFANTLLPDKVLGVIIGLYFSIVDAYKRCECNFTFNYPSTSEPVQFWRREVWERTEEHFPSFIWDKGTLGNEIKKDNVTYPPSTRRQYRKTANYEAPSAVENGNWHAIITVVCQKSSCKQDQAAARLARLQNIPRGGRLDSPRKAARLEPARVVSEPAEPVEPPPH